MHFSIVEATVAVLCGIIIATVVFRYIHLPIVLSYLFIGALFGPHVLGLIDDSHGVHLLAEFGVVLLMFTVGLEFSLSKLMTLKIPVFVLGSLQVLISLAIATILALIVHMDLPGAIVVGSIVAMSSTAIVIKQLNDQLEMNSKHGVLAVSILLFQDLAVIPLLILIASFSQTNEQTVLITMSWAMLKGVIAITAIIGIGHWLLRPLFHLIAATRAVELFTLSVLFIAIVAAWLTHAMGVSYALGAFLAGIMLGETEYRHQINIEIRPFRDVLLGLFFVSIGMLVDISTWLHAWFWILLLLIGLVAGKTLLIALLCLVLRYDFVTATRTGLVLGQGGEFGFALLTVALNHNLIPTDYSQAMIAALLISFALSPIIIRFNGRIAKFIFPKVFNKNIRSMKKDVKIATGTLQNHVIICGFGRVGQNIARFLDEVEHSYIGLELDPDLIRNAQLAGDRVTYGDATHPEILRAAKLDKAKAVVISLDDYRAAINILEYIRKMNSTIPVLARCKDQSAFDSLKEHGATTVVAEIFETSMGLANHLMQLLRVPRDKAARLLDEIRNDNYDLLCHVFPSKVTEDELHHEPLHECLRAVVIRNDVESIGKNLQSLALPSEVEVVSIRRNENQLKPKADLKIAAGDVIILYGLPDVLGDAEGILLA